MSEQDFMPIKGWDHIEFYVGNARQAAVYYQTTFGFTPVAYSGLETGVRDRASYVLQQGKIRLVLTTALGPDSPIAQHVLLAWRWRQRCGASGARRREGLPGGAGPRRRSAIEPTVDEG